MIIDSLCPFLPREDRLLHLPIPEGSTLASTILEHHCPTTAIRVPPVWWSDIVSSCTANINDLVPPSLFHIFVEFVCTALLLVPCSMPDLFPPDQSSLHHTLLEFAGPVPSVLSPLTGCLDSIIEPKQALHILCNSIIPLYI